MEIGPGEELWEELQEEHHLGHTYPPDGEGPASSMG